MFRSATRALLPAILAAACLGGCGGPSTGLAAGGADGARISLVAYSTPREAYGELIGAFARTAAGRGTGVSGSYGSSGEQARAVQAGLPADVVCLALAPDMAKLSEDGLVDPDWDAGRFGGMVTRSVVVFAVRKGNPKGIRTWEDLLRADVEVLTPNPFTSGGARWNVMAAYGAQRARGRTPAQAREYLRRLFANVVVQDKSAREALQTFAVGKGDVLIAYENEAITVERLGAEIEHVIPRETILVETPVAVASRASDPEAARGFVDFLRSPAGQRIFAARGYRPVRDELVDPRRFPRPAALFDIESLGGWGRVMDEFFDPRDSVMADVERSLGVATE